MNDKILLCSTLIMAAVVCVCDSNSMYENSANKSPGMAHRLSFILLLSISLSLRHSHARSIASIRCVCVFVSEFGATLSCVCVRLCVFGIDTD